MPGRCTRSRRWGCAAWSCPTDRPACGASTGTNATPRPTCRRRRRWRRPGTSCWCRELGRLLAYEARRKHVDVLLAPTVNLHRTPYGGRHFECFSEDPLLTSRLAVAYVRGLQDGGVGATVKHFVANDSETERMTLDARLDERTLHEMYLAPFEAVVREASVWAVMAAYNSVNGHTMTESPLLEEILRRRWGFDGVVMSDWFATRSTETSARAALDLVMPGPGGPWGDALARGCASRRGRRGDDRREGAADHAPGRSGRSARRRPATSCSPLRRRRDRVGCPPCRHRRVRAGPQPARRAPPGALATAPRRGDRPERGERQDPRRRQRDGVCALLGIAAAGPARRRCRRRSRFVIASA